MTPRERGFVLIVALAVLLALGALVSTRLDAGVSERIAAVRATEGAQARAIAESCLHRAIQFIRDQTGGGTPPPDFDALLNPSGAAANSYNTHSMVPAAPGGNWTNNPVVYVPKSVNGTAVTTGGVAARSRQEAMHQYRLLPDPSGAGACLIRYDDNADDALIDVSLGPGTQAGEGGSSEAWNLDRDRNIIVTAIGIVPYNPASPIDAYHRAHARITMRGLLQTEISSTASLPGLHAGGFGGLPTSAVAAAAPGNGVDYLSVCGVGGSETPLGATPLLSAGRLCTCGDDKTTLGVTGLGPCTGCAACATYGTSTGYVAPPTAPPAPHPDPHLLMAGSYLSTWIPNEAFRDSAGVGPFNLGTNVGQLGTPLCEVYFGSRQDDGVTTRRIVFVWDHTDADPLSTLRTAYSFQDADGNDADTGVDDNIPPAHDCTSYVEDPVKTPCDFDLTPSSPTYRCSATQTLCWKPVAVLNNTENQALGGSNEATKTDHGQEAFQMVRSMNVPFVSPAATWENFCGGPTLNTTRDDLGIFDTGARWEATHHDLKGNEWPTNGVTLIFESRGATSTNWLAFPKKLGPDSATDYFRGTVIAQSGIHTSAEVAICCPTCNCAGFPDSAPVVGCSGGAALSGRATGYSFFAQGHLYLRGGSKHKVIGHMRGASIQVDDSNNNSCIVGNMAAHERCATSCGSFGDFDALGVDACSGPTNPFGTPGVCLGDDTYVVGDVWSRGDLWLEPSSKLIGLLHYAQDDIGIGDSVEIDGEVYAIFGGSPTVEFRARDAVIRGRLVAKGRVLAWDKDNVIDWDGGGLPPTLNVQERVQWLEQAW